MTGGGQGRLGRFFSNWTVRSLLIGAVGSVVDLTILLFTAKVLGLPAALAAACGVTCGATANFFLNRRFSFQMQGQPISGPALRFFGGTAVLVALHAAMVATLTQHQAPLLVAKYASDVAILLGGNLLLLRYFVFPKPVAVAVPAHS